MPIDVELTGWLIVGALGLAATGIARLSYGSFRRVWEQAAREAGFKKIRVRRFLGWPLGVEGWRGPLRITLSGFTTGGPRNMGTQVVVYGLARDFGLAAAGTPLPGGLTLARPDVMIGDPAFDRGLQITGRPDIAGALLNHQTREQVRHMLASVRNSWSGGSASVSGAFRVQATYIRARAALGAHGDWVAAFVRDIVVLAEALQPVADVPARLLANLRDEPMASVRRTTLGLLARDHPQHDATREALRLASADPDDHVQVDAALFVGGSEGRDALIAIAIRETAADAASARAIRELGSAFTPDQACATLAGAHSLGRERTASACLDAITEGGPDHAAVVADVLSREVEGIAVAAARALGRIGGLDAIAALREAVIRLMGHVELRRAARQAVGAIQSRLVGAAPGQVSLSADGSQGRVSITDGGGQVAFVEPDD